MRKLVYFFFLILGFSGSLFANEASQKKEEAKIYISPDQLIVESEGMAVDMQGELFQIFSLFQDKKGYYILAHEIKRYTCPNGHETLRKDRLCYHPECEYYCGNQNVR